MPGKAPFSSSAGRTGAFLSGLRASARSLLSDGNHRFLGSWRKDDPPVCATRDVFWRRDGLPTSGWPGYSQRWIGQAGRCADTGTRRKRSVPLLAMACLPGNSPSRADFSRRARTPGQEGEPSHRVFPGHEGRRRSKVSAMRAATGGGTGRHSLRGPGRPGKQDDLAAHPCGKLATGKNHQSYRVEKYR